MATTTISNGPEANNVNVDGTSDISDFGGTDSYTILPTLSDDVSITDTSGATVYLPDGLAVSNVAFLSNGFQVTVNAHTLTLLGAPETFTYVMGGTPFDGGGTPLDFAATAAAFGTSVPATGEPANSGTDGTIGADGKVTPTTGGDKPDGDVDFTDDDGKIGTTTLEDFIIQPLTSESSDLISLNEFRADSRFSSVDGSGYTVVVIDTGIDLNHPAFGADANGDGISDRIVYSEDFTNDGDGTVDDVNGHGSNVASIVGSSAVGYTGMAPGANIVALQALSNSGSGRAGWVEKALQWVVANGQAYNVVAVNLSLGNGTNINSENPNPSGYADELSALNNLGIITVAAAGNDYFEYQEPGASDLAADPNVLAVGAVWDSNVGKVSFLDGSEDTTTAADRITVFSQRSTDLPTVMAPGGFITGAAPGGGTAAQAGTSQAAPHIAGIAALAQEIAEDNLGRRLTPAEYETLLLQSGVTITDGDDEDDNVVNTGGAYQRVDVLDLAEAILALDGSTPPPPPSQEDDIPGSVDTTVSLALGGELSGEIETAFDQDWVRVALTGGTSYQFDLRGSPSGAGTLSDPYLALHDSTGELITFNDDSGNSRESQIDFTAPSTGTYFLAARAYSDRTGTYLLQAAQTAGNTGDVPGDGSTTATLSAGQSVDGTLDFDGDTDWYQVSLTAGTNYQIDLQGAPSGLGTIADPLLRVFNASGDQVALDDDGGTSLESSLSYRAPSTGTFFLSAGSFRQSDPGTYRLSLAESGAAGGDIPGDTTTTATIAAGSAVDGTLDVPGDTDWFAFTPVLGAAYTIDLEGFGTNALSDPLVRLFDGSGTELDSNDDGGEGLNSQLTWLADTGSTVYIAAESFGNFGSGDYRISVATAQEAGGDVPGDPSTTETLSLGTVREGILEVSGDTDWYRLEVEAQTQYQISLEGMGDPRLRDPLVRVFDTSGNQLGFDDDGGTGLNSLLDFTPSSSGTVLVAADSYASVGTGNYGLLARVAGSDSSDTEDGTLLTSGTVFTGSLQTVGDTDTLLLALTSGQSVTLALNSGATEPSLSDPLLTVLDPTGTTEVARDDDGGPGLNSLLTFEAQSSGDFRVVVGAYADLFAGSYSLDVGVAGVSNLDMDFV